jgi:uncharacterized delta-60 repeat protein
MRTAASLAAATVVSALGLAVGQAPAQAITGGLDRSFGISGYVSTRLGATTSPGVSMSRVVVQPDGKIVVGGSVDDHPVVARFNSDGSPDAGFGSSGVARDSSVSSFGGTSVALDSAGRILVSGVVGPATGAGVVAFTPAGAVDTTFGSSGMAQASGFGATDLVLQEPGDKIVVVGGDGTKGGLARFTPAGTLDPSFGTSGVTRTGGVSEVEYVAIDSAGRIVAAGQDSANTAIERFTSSGTLDTTFATSGHLTVDESFAGGLAAVSDGYLFAATGQSGGRLYKFDFTGAPMGPFGSGGVGLGVLGPREMTVAPDGKIVVVGVGNPTEAGRLQAMAGRLDSSGSFDVGFGCNGTAAFNFENPFNQLTGVVAQADGSVVMAGATYGFEGDLERLVVARLVSADAADSGYRMLSFDADTEAFGVAAPCLTGTDVQFSHPPVGFASLVQDQGDWVVASDGGVFAFGHAGFFGSMGGHPLNSPIVGIAGGPANGGYWLVARDGGIFAFGTSHFFGSMGGQPLNQPVVGMAATPDGMGYWLVARDGGIFAFGTAKFSGSMGGQPLNQPVVGMAAAPDGLGYWLVARDGGIFAFGSAQFSGSMGGRLLNAPVVGMAAPSTGGGYWLLASDGGIFAFGGAPFYGSMGSRPTRGPWIGLSGL